MRKPKPWQSGEAASFMADIYDSPFGLLKLTTAPAPGPWDQPCGEALVDWPAFSAYLIDPDSERNGN